MKLKGCVDGLESGMLSGWVDLGTEGQAIVVRIEGEQEITCDATTYRADLETAGIRGGFASFRLPVRCSMLDGQIRNVELISAATGKPICLAPVKFELPHEVAKLETSVIRVTGSLARSSTSRVALFCGYEKSGGLSLNAREIIAVLQRAGFKVVFILAIDALNGGARVEKSNADVTILRKNIGYDFGSWAIGYLYLRRMLDEIPESVLLFNDSVLWTGAEIDHKFLEFDQGGIQYDVMGASESYDRRFHLQSFYLMFSQRVIRECLLEEFLLYRGALPSNRSDVIDKFELNSYSFFSERGLRAGASLAYNDLIASLWDTLIRCLDSYRRRYTDECLLRLTACMDLISCINSVREGHALNPSHACWLQLCRAGFPFIKKEIVTRNPVRVPFFELLRGAFAEKAVPGLEEFLRLTPGCLIPSNAPLVDPMEFGLDLHTRPAVAEVVRGPASSGPTKLTRGRSRQKSDMLDLPAAMSASAQ